MLNRFNLRRHRRGLSVAIIALAIMVFFAPMTSAQQARVPTARPADSTVSRGMGDASTPSQQLLEAMQQVHLTQCAARVQQVTNFLFDGQPARFTVQPLGPDADRWPTVIIVESADPAGGRTRFSTLMVAPNCAGMYQQVIYWPQACSVIRTRVFASFTGDRVLFRDVRVSDAGPALQVYLIPAGSGCMSIKKELFR